MPANLSGIATLLVFAVVFVLVVAVGKSLLSPDKRTRRGKWRGRGGSNVTPFRKPFKAVPMKGTAERTAVDAAEQLRLVMEADFQSRPLLNKGEAAVFKALDAAVIARNPGWQVMAQVNLGEFLSCKDRSAFFSVNSKRVDFALMDSQCQVRPALEYQGTGHHLPGGAAAARDAVKKEALRKAGIGYHEVVAGHTTPAELKRLVEKLVPAG